MDKKVTLVVIEDEKTLLANLVELLQIKGYEVFAADSGIEGLAMIKSIVPDVVLCDIRMPDMDGYEVLTKVRVNLKLAIPFIYLTAKAERESIRLGMNLGADDYITKPFKIQEVIDSITARLKRVNDRNEKHLSEVTTANRSIPDNLLGVFSKTERMVIQRILLGKNTKEIASELGVSPKTITNHRYNIAQKLMLRGTHSLTRFLMNKEWETELFKNKLSEILKIHG